MSREKGGNQEKGNKDKPRSAGSRKTKFDLFFGNTQRNKASRIMRANGKRGYVLAVRQTSVMTVRQIVRNAKKTSTNFLKWATRRGVPLSEF